MARKHASRKARAVPKTVLRLPDLDQAKSAVLNSLSSQDAQRGFRHAIDEFIEWYCSEPRLSFSKTVVLRYRMYLESRKLAPGTVNLRLGAVRRLAYEASDCGLLSPDLAAGIRRVKGVKKRGVRLGNWLTAEQGERLWRSPNAGRLKGKRDRALLAVLLACGLRRHEAVDLDFSHLQQREEHWAIVDIVGKAGHTFGQRGDAVQCRDLMIGAYLSKPLKSADLFEVIRRLCAAKSGLQTEAPRELLTLHSLRESKSKSHFPGHLRILIAEDNKVNQALARRLLEKEGHAATVVCDGIEAVAAFELNTYDLILMDVQMPNLDGLAATRAIRQRESGGRRIPIIALTAHATTSDRDQCLAAGMDDFVSKPIQVSDLGEAISKLAIEIPEFAEITAGPVERV